MSIKVMDAALECEELTDTLKTFVLVILGNWCDDLGGNCFPRIATIAKHARCDERHVRRILKELESEGWIRVERTKGGRPPKNANQYVAKGNRYFVNVRRLRGIEPGSRVCAADNAEALRDVDGRESDVRGNKVEAAVACGGDDFRVSSHSVSERGGVNTGMVSVFRRVGLVEFGRKKNPDKGDMKRGTTLTFATAYNKEEPSLDPSITRSVCAARNGESGELPERTKRLLAAQAVCNEWTRLGLPLADSAAKKPGAGAQMTGWWVSQVMPLVDAMGIEEAKRVVRQWGESVPADKEPYLTDELPKIRAMFRRGGVR